MKTKNQELDEIVTKAIKARALGLLTSLALIDIIIYVGKERHNA